MKNQIANDFDFLLSVGEIFTLVAYGQLIIEGAAMENIDDDILDLIFDFMVRDLSKCALDIYSKPASTAKQQELCLKMIRKPLVDEAKFKRVLEQHVYSLVGAYEINQ